MVSHTIIAIILIFGCFLTYRTIWFTSPLQNLPQVSDEIKAKRRLFQQEFPLDDAVKRFTRVIQYESIHYEKDQEVFDKMIAGLKQDFPKVSESMKRVGAGLLFKWEGKNDELDPVLLTCHLDVVPAREQEQNWKFDPFSGHVDDDGFIYGRGTLDVKSGSYGILEAVEYLMNTGFQPTRTIYISLGLDEEVGGYDGARVITDHLLEKGLNFAFILDEGGFISDSFATVSRNVALIAVAEKGELMLKITAHGDPGHSSIPQRNPPIVKLASAIVKLSNNPIPASISNGIVRTIFDYVGPYSSNILAKVMFANIDIFGYVLGKIFSRLPEANALIRTTTAFSKIEAGVKHNVIPGKATVYTNHRTAPHDTTESVINHVKSVINDDSLTVTLANSEKIMPPSNVSCTKCPEFEVLASTIALLDPELVIAPYLFVAGSDSKHYRRLSKHAFGFIPHRLRKADNDTKRFHGIDERIHVDNYREIIEYYFLLIQNFERLS